MKRVIILLLFPSVVFAQDDSMTVVQVHPVFGTSEHKVYTKSNEGFLQNLYAALANRPTLARVQDSLQAVRATVNSKLSVPVSSQGTGGTVTQLTNKTTGVTINKICGQITMNNAALAAAAEVSFTVTNSTVSISDVVIVNIQNIGTAGAYFVTVGAVSNGSFAITVGNVSTGSLSQALVLNFMVLKSVNN